MFISYGTSSEERCATSTDFMCSLLFQALASVHLPVSWLEGAGRACENMEENWYFKK